jgi:hypothetical protein
LPKKRWRFLERHGPLTSLVLTLPIFLAYHLGILLIDLRNGVDLVSGLTLGLLEHSVIGYVAVTLGFAVALVAALAVLRRNHDQFNPRELLPVVGESIVLAIGMLILVGWATGRVFANQTGPEALGFVDRIVMACGAGFHEELIFRVVLFAGGAFLLTRFSPLPDLAGVLIAAVVSSLIFSSVHYIGAMGDTFSLVSFTFRAIAGLYLAAVYYFRGFAVAVYTHTIYDLLVFFII